MSRKKVQEKVHSGTGWDRALAEAERQIKQYKLKIHELNGSIRIMQEKIASGEAWPMQSNNQKSAQQHSV